jgi:lysophospholipase L1-like esterase
MARLGRYVVARAAVSCTIVGLLTFGGVWQATEGFAVARHARVTHGYLALGDSVTFGYREANTTPAPNYLDAPSFIGYPKDVGLALGLQVANAACPGETSLSLIKKGVQSNGCENVPGGGPGYRSAFPLHVSYKGTQLAYADAYLKTHRSTQLVTLMIGANDAFLCQETTADKCASELPAVLKQISSNVAAMLGSIRTSAHYKGQIVVVNYYSLDYANAVDNAASQTLNTTVDKAAKPYHVQIADGYGAFKAAALQSGGDTCKAGLLTQLTSTGCGVHPSIAGQALLALAVEEVVKR